MRLDAAPHILHTVSDQGGDVLRSHTGRDVAGIHAWWLDDGGKLYAQADLGPALVAGRDLAVLLARLRLADGVPLLEALEHGPADGQMIRLEGHGKAAALHFCAAADIAGVLGFVRCPALSRITP